MQMLQVSIGPDTAAQQTQTQLGYRLSDQPETRVLQLKNDGFAYSRLAPYVGWTRFRDEAAELWDRYRATMPSAKLSRCGLRYINRIEVPERRIEIEDYFQLHAKVPDALPHKDVSGTVLNVQMPQLDLECMATVTHAFIGQAKPDHLSFVLDIDLSRLGIADWTDSQAWEFFDRMRVRKNEIFEACITDRTRRLFE